MNSLDAYFPQPGDGLDHRMVIERRLHDGKTATVTYEWNGDLPTDIQKRLIAKQLDKLGERSE
jgi:hypothetical protein